MLREVKEIPDDAEAYRAAIVDWGHTARRRRSRSSPDEVIARSRPRGDDEARGAACFELGQHLRRTRRRGRRGAVVARAHELDPGNWTYKRQAWTLVTTARGATENDLMQGPNDVYDGNWLDDVLRRVAARTTPSCPNSEPRPLQRTRRQARVPGSIT